MKSAPKRQRGKKGFSENSKVSIRSLPAVQDELADLLRVLRDAGLTYAGGLITREVIVNALIMGAAGQARPDQQRFLVDGMRRLAEVERVQRGPTLDVATASVQEIEQALAGGGSAARIVQPDVRAVKPAANGGNEGGGLQPKRKRG